MWSATDELFDRPLTPIPIELDEEEKLESSASTNAHGVVSPPRESYDVYQAHHASGLRPRRSRDERREQNRLTVQRFYYRKKKLMQGMREEEERLRHEFAALSTAISDRTKVREQSETTQLILLKESLQHQNELLREMVSDQSRQLLQFSRAFNSSHQQVAGDSGSSLLAHEYIPQVSKASCEQTIRNTLREISDAKSAVCAADAAQFSMFEWDCQFSSSESSGISTHQFVFSKMIRSGASALQLAQRTLEMWTPLDPMHAHLFPAYTQSHLRLLQQIDDRNVILLQTVAVNWNAGKSGGGGESIQVALDQAGGPTCATSSSGKSCRVIVHVSLVETEPDECIFFIRSVSPEHYELSFAGDESSAGWIDVFSWCTIKTAAGGAEVKWGGRTSSAVRCCNCNMNAFEWLIYELTRAVRWEIAITDSSILHNQ